MARLYSGKKGKSGSTKPVTKVPPSWVKYKPFEIEKLVVKLAKEGKNSAEIGIILRDMYGIPNVKATTKKKITKIMEENNLSPKIPEDLMNLIKKAIAVEKHHKNNKKDKTSKRGLLLTESKIRRLVKYYKAKKILPEDWKYTRKNAKFLVK